MAANWTSADLINAVKAQETIPDSGAAYSDETLVQFLNFSMNEVVGAINTVKEDYFIETKDVTLTSQMVNFNGMPQNVDNVVVIPPESSGLTVHDVYLVGSSGGFISLPRITAHQAAAQAYSWFGYGGAGGTIDPQNLNGMCGYFLQGNQIQIFPYTLASGTRIRVTFRRNPNYMCLVNDAAQVISIAGDVVTVGNAGTGWTPSITHLCAVSQHAPHPFVIDATVPTDVYCTPHYIEDFILQGISGNVLTLPTGIAANINVGDWVCPQGFSTFAMNIPQNFYPSMVQRAAAMCLEAAGDGEGQQFAMKTFNTMMKQAIMQIAPRVDSQPVKALPINSAFKASRRRFWTR